MLKSIFLRTDYLILVPALLIVFLSFFVLSSFQPDLARSQAVFALFGVLIYFSIQLLNTYDLRTFTYHGYILILLVLVALFFVGEISRGSNRWIPVWGELRIQPSEFAKPMLVLTLARVFSSYKYFNWQFFLKTVITAGIYFALVFLQPDLGTALVFLSVWVVILFSSEMSKKTIAVILLSAILAGGVLGPIVWRSLHDYQRDRILTFLNPQRDPLGRGYNALQAIITVGSGGLYGKGLGQGTQSHNKFLPEQYTDFAFATFSEEFGFTGVLVLFSLYGIMLWRILRLSDKTQGRFAFGVCVGVATIVFFQIFVNVGMNTGLMPITGITLPFFSYGGSSLISFFVCLGLVQTVAGVQKEVWTESL